MMQFQRNPRRVLDSPGADCLPVAEPTFRIEPLCDHSPMGLREADVIQRLSCTIITPLLQDADKVLLRLSPPCRSGFARQVTSLRGSTYGPEYDLPLRSLRPYWGVLHP
jgi:hypothetical protein